MNSYGHLFPYAYLIAFVWGFVRGYLWITRRSIARNRTRLNTSDRLIGVLVGGFSGMGFMFFVLPFDLARMIFQ